MKTTKANMTTAELNRAAFAAVMLAVPFNGDGIGAPGRIILQWREGVYVVHWQNGQDGGCGYGVYHGANFQHALLDFTARVNKESKYATARGETLELETFDQTRDMESSENLRELLLGIEDSACIDMDDGDLALNALSDIRPDIRAAIKLA